ncbi:AraC family transcriptional regulator [Burkholderia gladioli]|jgi:transcriptional regulator GlxA family with amidase domain|uniref:Helix-turn-helix domain protein n=1 Tax=Burkholderia gladioli TaxID=28095 RepID=A0AAW3F2D7_BURGA|nr:GlxA family transcriptional regulator [Burkholderia gladioli]AJW96445.1 helix-turn-helix domain protein [Burkholderia gladioli]ASD82845.1 AraC family transcriptional regulator [Burkholderia gladioli pv. gladioli]AWY50281.1 AraC family transcriptional regulator [Burkholderia gladioli pv. gladioli]KAF1059661.1 HTH-type transcriptional regulator CdhR [Burkholderia gladioli]KGC15022.1 helix-turn-helix domain protein [Burkholderia gladioli]
MTPDLPASLLSADPAPTRLRFGIVLLPNFTLTAFSGFVDMLRLSADDGDYSKPVRCAWSVIGDTLAPVRASCGIQITPWETFDAGGEPYDYVVVVGGLLHSGPQASPEALQFIRRAAEGGANVVGICTGVFALMRAGVLDAHRICVSWFHYWDFIERFPNVDAERLIADRLFVIDRRRITCSGGRASIDVAAAILLRHFDHATVQKALRILLVGEMQKGNAPQPHPPGLEPATHPKVKRAILLMEQHVGRALPLDELACKLDLSARQLERLFKAETGKSPQAFAKQVRLRTAAWLLTSSDRTVADIATSCGFSDASHLGREFRKQFGATPAAYREKGGAAAEVPGETAEAAEIAAAELLDAATHDGSPGHPPSL